MKIGKQVKLLSFKHPLVSTLIMYCHVNGAILLRSIFMHTAVKYPCRASIHTFYIYKDIAINDILIYQIKSALALSEK